MNFTIYVEQEKKKKRLENIEEVRREIDSAWVKEKIENHIQAFEGIMSFEDVREAILTDIIVASKFCKDPSKQNISEKLARKVLGTPKLPTQGKNCIRFNDNGDIVSVKEFNTKSADFKYKEYYVTQKYTDASGGAQDNQFADVVDFLKRGSIKYKVAAIVDGSFWDEHRPLLEKEFSNNPNVLITSITDITEKNKS